VVANREDDVRVDRGSRAGILKLDIKVTKTMSRPIASNFIQNMSRLNDTRGLCLWENETLEDCSFVEIDLPKLSE